MRVFYDNDKDTFSYKLLIIKTSTKSVLSELWWQLIFINNLIYMVVMFVQNNLHTETNPFPLLAAGLQRSRPIEAM